MPNWFQRKIDEMQRKRRKIRYAEDEFFCVYTRENVDPKTDLIAVEILKGDFKGIAYAYTSCDVGSDGRCSFDIRIIKTSIEERILLKNRNFSKIVGQVLLVILESALQNMKDLQDMKEEYDELESGEGYIEEPVQSRTVHQKNSAISEE